MKILNGIPVFGDPVDMGALNQMITCMESDEAIYGALMGDHHKGYAMPIGGVIAYDEAVSPSSVGYDIACGNKAVRLNLHVSELFDGEVERIMDAIYSQISFGVGRVNNEPVDHSLFDDSVWTMPALSPLKDLARNQLGTVGSGNHFVDVFMDEVGYIWTGVHFGSRGLGHKTATYFLKEGGAKDGMDVEPLVLSTKSYLGQDYIEAMKLCGSYAYAGRDWVCSKVARIIGAPIVEEVHNHHNYAWLEVHNDTALWTVRKGSTPLWGGQRAFIGGSMGDKSYIVEGVVSETSINALFTAPHGAGRIMSRTEAAGKIDRKTGEQKTQGKISPEMMMEWMNSKGIILRGGGTDESPHVYKRIDEVLEHHSETLDIVHELTPLGVCMAGKGEFDPYKD